MSFGFPFASSTTVATVGVPAACPCRYQDPTRSSSERPNSPAGLPAVSTRQLVKTRAGIRRVEAPAGPVRLRAMRQAMTTAASDGGAVSKGGRFTTSEPVSLDDIEDVASAPAPCRQPSHQQSKPDQQCNGPNNISKLTGVVPAARAGPTENEEAPAGKGEGFKRTSSSAANAELSKNRAAPLRAASLSLAARGEGKITSTDLTVCLALIDRMGANGCSWPSYERVASDLQISRRTAIRSISQIEEAGLLEVVRRRDRASNETNVYYPPREPWATQQLSAYRQSALNRWSAHKPKVRQAPVGADAVTRGGRSARPSSGGSDSNDTSVAVDTIAKARSNGIRVTPDGTTTGDTRALDVVTGVAPGTASQNKSLKRTASRHLQSRETAGQPMRESGKLHHGISAFNDDDRAGIDRLVAHYGIPLVAMAATECGKESSTARGARFFGAYLRDVMDWLEDPKNVLARRAVRAVHEDSETLSLEPGPPTDRAL